MFKFFKGYIEPCDIWVPPLPTESFNPRFYDTVDFTFIGVSEINYNLDYPQGYRHMLFQHIQGGNTLIGNIIGEDHPMYWYSNVREIIL